MEMKGKGRKEFLCQFFLDVASCEASRAVDRSTPEGRNDERKLFKKTKSRQILTNKGGMASGKTLKNADPKGIKQ